MNSNGWSQVPLSEIVEPVQRTVAVEPGKSFRTLGVKWWGEGAYERQTIDGSQTAASTLNEVRENDLIINKIWVRHGSVAVVPPEVAGCCGSNEFPTFEFRRERVLPRWMHWYSKARELWLKCDSLSQGTSGKNRIRPEKFLTITIPLPPLEEQQRIVARIDRLASMIDEAKSLRSRATTERRALLAQAMSAPFESLESPRIPLAELLRERSRNGLSVAPSNDPPGRPILRISAGTSRDDGIVDETDFRYVDVGEREASDCTLSAGDLLACRFNGNLHYVGKFSLFAGETGRRLLHPDKLIRFRVDPEHALPEYVRDAMNSSIGRAAIESFCQTTAGNIGISAKNLNTVSIPVPPITEQRRIVRQVMSLREKVTELNRLQQQSSSPLDAALPSILDRAFKGDL